MLLRVCNWRCYCGVSTADTRYAPAVYLVKKLLAAGVAVRHGEKLPYPSDQMVLEGTLDELMENVGYKQLVYISARKAIGERLPQ